MVELSLSGSFTAVDSDSSHFYIVGDSGLDIINKVTQRSEGFVTFSSGFNDVWAGDEVFVYIAADTGLYFLAKPDVFSLGEDLTDQLFIDSRTNLFQDSEVLKVTGLNREYILIGTISGVELLVETNVFHSNEFNPIDAVEITDSGDLYYGGSFGLAFKSGPVSANWSSEQHIVSPFIPNNQVNAIDTIKNDVSDITVGVATASGVVLFQQRNPLAISPTTKFFTEN